MDVFRFVVILILCLFFVAVILWSVFRYIKFYKEEHLVCPKCYFEFKPSVLKMIFSINTAEGKYIKCPNCNSKGYCGAYSDNKTT